MSNRAAVTMTGIVIFELFAENIGGNFLQLGIKRGTDNQSAFIKGVFAKILLNFAADFLTEIIGIFNKRSSAVNRFQRFGNSGIGFGFADIAVFQHAADNPVAAGYGRIIFGFGIIIIGSFGQGGQISGFFQGQITQRFSEIIQRRCGNAVRAVAQINFIQIKLQDMLFAESLFNARGQNSFFNLAGNG